MHGDTDLHALLTPEEMAGADRAAMAAGHDGVGLMEAAGLAVARAVQARWQRGSVVVLCGPGNNGGDGFVIARHLAAAGWPVTVALLGERTALRSDAAHHAALWQGDVVVLAPAVLDGVAGVVDALFGAGLSRDLAGAARATVEALAASGLPVCAVDVPSGIDGDSGQIRGAAARADFTVTFFRKKPGHLLLPGRQFCGELIVADIGIPASVLTQVPPRAHENDPALWLARFPWPRVDGHKYARGHALVVGGAVMTGAARLSASAAARVGAGLVTVAAPQSAWQVYASALTSIMVQPLAHAGALDEVLADARKNAIAIGPGAGVSAQTRRHVLAALGTGRAVVLDADAITTFAGQGDTLFEAIHGPCVMTPHEGEFGRLFPGSGSKTQRARAAAAQSGAVVLLKGPDTVIAAPDGRVVINTNAPPDLATGGSGDVLTGMITGLLAQGMTAFDAAACAAWLHGAAAHAFGPGLIAEDIPAQLPAVFRALRGQGESMPG
ncbi:bifunctional ADP-dependent NAD(P)H-hydrate dehydratase/NAD(P)H-hydrate epimerase [Bordetella sp. N]|uniref:bifunctional ADP-dependent NAD(P)H-hydrate dehydratase/NAD(P)H-hydrate epimerase n=1 Tax=Bordetella sp. N TaxID=1746199 RepID=UPI000709BCF3|nr:bifunctional ADP-dependent NAD(P)H-hydrate dehydratase/NAD(P)H-hydrate epimerase [Bordetella sp. N]ALM82643.1 bifunctional ADP-dependent (S)-NAD(P)H-hydrate dehydratase/NAD(P)H-hydrate epimerase [Bordetella sp. N]